MAGSTRHIEPLLPAEPPPDQPPCSYGYSTYGSGAYGGTDCDERVPRMGFIQHQDPGQA